jgi:hypothetical protein
MPSLEIIMEQHKRGPRAVAFYVERPVEELSPRGPPVSLVGVLRLKILAIRSDFQLARVPECTRSSWGCLQ